MSERDNNDQIQIFRSYAELARSSYDGALRGANVSEYRNLPEFRLDGGQAGLDIEVGAVLDNPILEYQEYYEKEPNPPSEARSPY